MAKAAKNSLTNLKVLAREYGEDRWREVIRLFVAMAPRSLFDAFMKEVIACGRLGGHHDLTSLCLREAEQPSEEPFKASRASWGPEDWRVRFLIGRTAAMAKDSDKGMGMGPGR